MNKPTLLVNAKKEGHLLAQAINNEKKKEKMLISISDKLVDDEPYITEILDNKYTFFHLPNDKAKRDCLYVCGPNQAGKSTYVSKYLSRFCKANPDTPITVISKIEQDDVLDSIKNVERLPVDEFEFGDEGLDQFADTLMVFDDVDQIHDPEKRSMVVNCINEVMCHGAHYNINICITNHLMSDYKNTRTILNECSSITVFPKSGCSHQLNYVLKNYIGMGPEDIQRVKSLNSRWVTVFKNYPIAVLHQNGVYLL